MGVPFGIFFGKKFHFSVKVTIFIKNSGIFGIFLAIILFLGINLAKIINSVLFNIKIKKMFWQFPCLFSQKIIIFFIKIGLFSNLLPKLD